MRNEPEICVEFGLAFGLLTSIKANMNTDSCDWACVLPTLSECIFVSKSAASTPNTVSTFFFCLSHALSCMLTHANHLPWHCDLLELRIKDFILKMPRGKTEVPSWVTMLIKAKVNAWKPIVFLFDFLFKEEKEKNTTKYKSW